MKIPKQIKLFEELIGIKSVWTDPITKRPSREDFEQGRIAIREDLVKRILDNMLKKGQFCIIVGPHDSGKTWLCYALGCELEKRGKPFRFIEVDEDFDAYVIWNYISRLPFHWIIDECQNNKSEVDEFLQKILQSEQENLKFIFVVRKPSKLTEEDGILYNLSVKEQCEICLGKATEEKSIEHVETIIKSFIETENVRKYVEVTDEEIQSVAKRWGCDLHGVSLRLKLGWDFKNGMNLSEVKDSSVYDYMWSYYGKWRLELMERRNTLLPASILCLFGPLSVWSLFLYRTGQKTVIKLEQEGIIERVSWEGKDFFRIPEGDADWCLKTFSNKISSEFVHTEIKRTFKEYIKSRPPNWTYVFRCLYLSRDTREERVKEILTSILADEEVWKTIKGMVEKEHFFSLALFPSLSQVMIWADQTQKVQDVWYCIKRKSLNQILSELSSCKIQVINNFVSLIKQIDGQYFKAMVKGFYPNISYPNLERSLQKASIQSQCKFCFIVFYANPPLSYLVVENMQRQLKSGTANNIRKALPPLNGIRKITTLQEFFIPFTVSDWENIVKNSSTFDSIYHLLCDSSKKWKLENAARNLAKALLKIDIRYLITQKGASAYRLYGVIARVQKLGIDITPLVKGVIQSDVRMLKKLLLIHERRQIEGHEEPKNAFLFGLNGIAQMGEELDLKTALLIKNLSKFEKIELKKLFSKSNLKVVNFFLSQVAKHDPSSCSNIIKKVGGDTWAYLIRSTFLSQKQKGEQAFWLLWNIYRFDRASAKRLAKRTKHLFCENLTEGKFSDIWLLPLIGLLNLCNVNLREKFLNKIYSDRALQIIEGFKNRENPSGTLILLSLVALKYKLSKEEFLALKEKIINDPKVKECIRNNPDRQLIQVFQEILQNIQF